MDINRTLAEKCMGWELINIRGAPYGLKYTVYNSDPKIGVADWNPRTDIAQAMMVVDKLVSEGWILELIVKTDYTRATFMWGTDITVEKLYESYNSTPAEAICKAAVKTI